MLGKIEALRVHLRDSDFFTEVSRELGIKLHPMPFPFFMCEFSSIAAEVCLGLEKVVGDYLIPSDEYQGYIDRVLRVTQLERREEYREELEHFKLGTRTIHVRHFLNRLPETGMYVDLTYGQFVSGADLYVGSLPPDQLIDVEVGYSSKRVQSAVKTVCKKQELINLDD